MEKLWCKKYVVKVDETRTLNGCIRYIKDKWGAVLYVKNGFGDIQCIYENEKDYLEAISVAGGVTCQK